MCGILGQLNIDQYAAPFPSLSLLDHRGPDGSGDWYNQAKTIYLGHTRLSILDVSPAGRQPMTDGSGRFTIVFNGEIYNHLSLRLLMPDVAWRGNSDTETLLELLARKGTDSLTLLKGMFAFSLHDVFTDSVLLVRDRLGIKPLWLRTDEHTRSFSSEIRAIRRSEDTTFTQQALSEYIGFGRLPGTGQIIDNVEAVPAGSWVRLHADGQVEKKIWWPDGRLSSPPLSSRTDYVKRVRQLVSTAIEEHLLSDVGVGAFLSGGIDSSIVALIAGKALGRQLQTFTVGFPQRDFDERDIARIVARRAGSEHVELEIQQESCLEWVQEAVDRMDLPSVDAINTYIVSRAVRESGLKVALSGLGGDELFGGYPSFKQVPWLNFLNSLPNRFSRQLVSVMPRRLRDKLNGLPDFEPSTLAVACRRFTSVTSLTSMELSAGVPVLPVPPAGLDIMGLISWAELQGYMIPMLLRDSDQMSMAVGLEIRVPFLDHQLTEEVLAIPDRYKKGRGTKPLLVDAFRDCLPAEVFNRPKQGFALPMDLWMRGPLAEFTKTGVEVAADLLKLDEPRQQLTSFQQGLVHWTRVWHWCILGYWLEKVSVPQRVDSTLS